MVRNWLARLAISAALVAPMPPILAQDFPGSFGDPIPLTRNGASVRYGDSRDQTVTIFRARSMKLAPVVVVLNIGWQDGANRYGIGHFISALNDRGIAVVAVYARGKRLEEDSADLVSALKHLKSQSVRHRLDLSRIAVFGRGAGGSFAVLLGTDPSALSAAEIPFEALRAVVSIDGDGVDIDEVASQAAPATDRAYFNEDAALRRRLSAVSHIAAPNAPSFYFLNYSRSPRRLELARRFADSLPAGVEIIHRQTATSDGNIGGNRFGRPGNKASDDLLKCLRDRLS